MGCSSVEPSLNIMTEEQKARYNYLKSCFDSWGNFVYFKGSKCQRKAALREWNKLCAIKRDEEHMSYIENLRNLYSNLLLWGCAEQITSVKFWWEVTSEKAVKEMRHTAQQAAHRVSRMINWENGTYGCTTEYPIVECIKWIEKQLIG